MTWSRWLFIAIPVVAACSDPPERPNDPAEFSISPARQWSGGAITIRSSLFTGRADLPAILVDGLDATVNRIDDSTVGVTLPILPSQTGAPVKVVEGATAYNVGTIVITGFRSRAGATPGFLWEPVGVQEAGGPAVVGGTFSQPGTGGITLVDLRTGQSRIETGVAPAYWSSGHGAGVSYQPGHLILRDSSGAVGDWQVTPTLAHVDTIPAVTFSRSVARLSPDVWLFTSNHTTMVRRTGNPDISVPMEDPFGFHLSSAADRAVLSTSQALGGVPVFAMSTGDTLFRLSLPGLAGAAFRSDGGRLFLTAGSGGPATEVQLVNAATGALIDSKPVPPGFEAFGVALSAAGDRLFVAMMADSVPHLAVYATDGDSLAQVGMLGATDATACSSCGSNMLYQALLVLDEATGTIFLASQGEPALIWAFDILPAIYTGLPAKE